MLADAVGIEAAMDTITTGISATTIWNNINSVLPFVVVMTGVSISVYFLRRILKKASKAKAGL